MPEKRWVVCWVVPTSIGVIPINESGCHWLMVKHFERGWELPGGWIEDEEASEEAALRELFEESGLLGTATAVANGLLEGGGDVVLIHIDAEPTPLTWDSPDSRIEEVGWCLIPPEPLGWGEDELRKISSHDWSNERTASS